MANGRRPMGAGCGWQMVPERGGSGYARATAGQDGVAQLLKTEFVITQLMRNNVGIA